MNFNVTAENCEFEAEETDICSMEHNNILAVNLKQEINKLKHLNNHMGKSAVLRKQTKTGSSKLVASSTTDTAADTIMKKSGETIAAVERDILPDKQGK